MEVIDLQRFDDFLKESRIMPERNRPWCVRWVERFLKSPAAARSDLSAEDRVRVFVDDLSGRGRLEDWQIDQADKSVRLYYYQFRGGGRGGDGGGGGLPGKTAGARRLQGANTRRSGPSALQGAFRERIDQAGVGGDGFLRGGVPRDAGEVQNS